MSEMDETLLRRESVFLRMEKYAVLFIGSGKPQHAEVIRKWIADLRRLPPLSEEAGGTQEALQCSMRHLLPLARAWVDHVHAPNDRAEVERIAGLLHAALTPPSSQPGNSEVTR